MIRAGRMLRTQQREVTAEVRPPREGLWLWCLGGAGLESSGSSPGVAGAGTSSLLIVSVRSGRRVRAITEWEQS